MSTKLERSIGSVSQTPQPVHLLPLSLEAATLAQTCAQSSGCAHFLARRIGAGSKLRNYAESLWPLVGINKNLVFIGENGAPKGTILELSSPILWQPYHSS